MLTRKVGEPTPLTQRPVQQSDYVALWSNEPRRAARSTRKSAFARALQELLMPLRHRAKVARKDVAGARSDMTARRVLDLTPMPALPATPGVVAPSAVGAASVA